MAQKNQPETGDWRKRVSNLEALPDTAIDTAVLWNRLRSRPVKKKKFLLYYILAAAALVGLIFVIPFIKPVQQPPRKLSVQKTNHSEPAPVISPSSEPISSKKSFAPTMKPEPVVAKHIARKPNVPDPVVETKIPVTEPIVDVITTPDTSTASAPVAVAPVKKLKVLHINEITPNNGTQENISRQTPREMRRFRKEMRSLPSYATHQSSDNIIKINLPSN